MKNALNWFEIPTTNIDRAAKFYEAVLGASLHREVIAGIPNAILPYSGGEDGAVGGALVQNPRLPPGAAGGLPYLNCTGFLDEALARVGAAGGAIVMPKTDIGFGHIALIVDTEGNRIGLHSV